MTDTAAPEQPESIGRTIPRRKYFRTLVGRVSDLGFSRRTAEFLRDNNIILVGDLVLKSEKEILLGNRGGRKSLEEVQDVLTGMGLRLNTTIPEWPPSDVGCLLAQIDGESPDEDDDDLRETEAPKYTLELRPESLADDESLKLTICDEGSAAEEPGLFVTLLKRRFDPVTKTWPQTADDGFLLTLEQARALAKFILFALGTHSDGN